MADQSLAVQAAVIALLTPALTVPVYEHPPEDSKPPLAVVSSDTGSDAGGKSGGLDRHEVTVTVYWTGPARKPGLDIVAVLRGALDNVRPLSSSALLSALRFLDVDVERLGDGDLYAARVRYLIFAQPA